MHEEFFYSCKTHKRLLKSKKQWSVGQIYFKKLNKLAVLAISLNFFCFYLKNFPSWIRIPIQYADPVPGDKMNADPCGYGSTALPTILQYMSIVLS